MNIKLKDPGSAITHAIGLGMAIFAALPLMIKAEKQAGSLHLIACFIFILSMILLYGASTAYHALDISPTMNKRLKKADHMMIFVLIAGSYTPICAITLHGKTGFILLSLVWGIAVIGIVIKACWIYCPKWFSSALYIALGWICLLAFSQIFHSLPRAGFIWLVAGGVIYTIGGVIYALKLKVFNSKHEHFGSHEVFHLFVMGGSICHYIVIYFYVAAMPIS